MRFYFLTERPCTLTVNGVFFGTTDLFERSANLDPTQELALEFAPLGDYLPVRFLLNEAFLFAPPPRCSLYFLPEAVALYVDDFLRADASMQILWQKRFSDTLLTLSMQGKLQLNVTTERELRVIPLPERLIDCTVRETVDGFLLESKTAFALVSRKGELLLSEEGSVVSCEEGITALLPYRDALRHSALCTYRQGELVSKKIRAEREVTETTLALALFESVRINADCTPYLSPELTEKVGALQEYLGNFTSVVMTDERDKIGLCYPRKPRVFDVRYFRVEKKDGKISNLIPL